MATSDDGTALTPEQLAKMKADATAMQAQSTLKAGSPLMDPAALSTATTPTFDDLAMQLAKKKRMQRMQPTAAASTGNIPNAMSQALARYGVK
jgi:hypothetical protein